MTRLTPSPTGRTCPGCGQRVTGEANYCPSCGTQVAADPWPAPPRWIPDDPTMEGDALPAVEARRLERSTHAWMALGVVAMVVAAGVLLGWAQSMIGR